MKILLTAPFLFFLFIRLRIPSANKFLIEFGSDFAYGMNMSLILDFIS